MDDQAARKYVIPSFDVIRVQNLRDLNLLDTAPDPYIDELVRLASVVADMPISALSLVDKNRQWFKAKTGLEVSETARDISFCTYTILNSDRPLIVEDASKSDVFRNNPLVLNEPHIRSYVGFPINSPDHGFTIGSLCVIDRKPRALSEYQLKILREIAVVIMKTISR
ncbi:MAG: GAF domain-containing protein [Proteobacteria bacterium]|nr:MAG: GAF domain-containing protein [Pseudomonadota bacterium]